jgi:molybdopterin/thiamine biosynthesis adenylyltransferase
MALPFLDDHEQERYSWQTSLPELGEAGQRRLKGASVLVSRVGGLGGVAALELAAAGVGRLILAHGGNLKASDLNRQILMRHGALGDSRVATAAATLRALNPRCEIIAEPANISEANAERLVALADVVVDAAPLFVERFAVQRAAVARRIPVVECAMYELEATLTTVIPGQTACLRCLHPEDPPHWRRRFPVLGAVSGSVGCLAALEAIKVISGLAPPLAGCILRCDLRDLQFQRLQVQRRADCALCGHLP